MVNITCVYVWLILHILPLYTSIYTIESLICTGTVVLHFINDPVAFHSCLLTIRKGWGWNVIV